MGRGQKERGGFPDSDSANYAGRGQIEAAEFALEDARSAPTQLLSVNGGGRTDRPGCRDEY